MDGWMDRHTEIQTYRHTEISYMARMSLQAPTRKPVRLACVCVCECFFGASRAIHAHVCRGHSRPTHTHSHTLSRWSPPWLWLHFTWLAPSSAGHKQLSVCVCTFGVWPVARVLLFDRPQANWLATKSDWPQNVGQLWMARERPT